MSIFSSSRVMMMNAPSAPPLTSGTPFDAPTLTTPESRAPDP